MGVTASDIAQKLGVSRQSVSKVLVGGKTNIRVSSGLAVRIRQTAQEMGYRPNTAARSISTGRTGSIDLLLSTQSGPSRLPTRLIGGIHDALIAKDMQLTVSRLPDSQLTNADFIPKILRERSADGILINYTHHVPRDLPAMLSRHAIPSVWINNKRETLCTYPDEISGYRQATERLLSLGHQRVAFHIMHEDGHFSEVDRRLGYEQAMQNAGLEPVTQRASAQEGQFYEDEPLADDRLKRVLEWLGRPDRPTAVLAYSQLDTNVIAYAAALLNLKLGRDLSLIGITDGVANQFGMPITQLQLPHDELGRVGVELLLKQIAKPSLIQESRHLEMPMIEGLSVGRPSSAH